MPKAKNAGSGGTDILALLAPERRQAVLEEAIGAHVRGIVEKHSAGTWGDLVTALRGDARWAMLRDVPLSLVIRPSAASATAARAPRSAAKPAKARGRRRGLDQAVLDDLLKFIQKTPGLRSEEIQARVEVDRGVVKRALAKLRDTKRVKTKGEKRVTTYFAA